MNQKQFSTSRRNFLKSTLTLPVALAAAPSLLTQTAAGRRAPPSAAAGRAAPPPAWQKRPAGHHALHGRHDGGVEPGLH